MAEFIKERENPDTAYWSIMEALAVVPDTTMETVVANKKSEGIAVELRINGVEVSFRQIIKRLREHAEDFAIAKAKEMLIKRAGILQEKLQRLQRVAEGVEFQVEEEIKVLFPERR